MRPPSHNFSHPALFAASYCQEDQSCTQRLSGESEEQLMDQTWAINNSRGLNLGPSATDHPEFQALSNTMLRFSPISSQDPSSQCNRRTPTGRAAKRAKIQQFSHKVCTLKVRKEKLGDRITALHQLVSPFGKTDTASVLLEAIGYIKFLQNQVEALSVPYLGCGSGSMTQQHAVKRNYMLPDEPGQECDEEPNKDLRSRGLCLVPISCTLEAGSDF